MKKAFTLLELIIVIVIVGIISYIGVEITLNIYKNYLQSRAINTLETQTELVLEQISKRLAIRVKGSAIGKRINVNGRGNFVSTSSTQLNNNFPILEWVAYSYESFQDGSWTGFIDLNNPSSNSTKAIGILGGSLATPGSRLLTQVSQNSPASANQNIKDLTNYQASIENQNIGVIFKGTNLNSNSSFGYNNSAAQAVALVANSTQDTSLNVIRYAGALISEQYYLLHTAYAIVPGQASADNDFDLFLHYNFRPWVRQEYTDGNRNLLATNVTRFNFTEANGVLVLKLCIRDAGRSLDPTEAETTVCKTKAVY
ncbi:MAG: prepilin-type N-terminal cleavage/methylation domain-containing protein [Campylobacter sp.]|uniref:prepilin-type N-terminal cleavage/methylation domain-containing protein n=1 Tax=Campylobacter sp. TaxID=205 RepID=UPI00360B3510